MSALTDSYFDCLSELLSRARSTQREKIEEAGSRIADSLRNGGVVHLFGTGHSHMIAEEVFYRAGGLIPVNAMLDSSVVLSGGATRSTEIERTPGAAAEIAARYDLREGDAGIVISHSGRNPAPVEMARLMTGKGMAVIAITSFAHSNAVRILDPPGARLLEIADIALDTGSAFGDAALKVAGVLHPAGPTSTVLATAILQAVLLSAMEQLVASGTSVVNLPSGNIEGADLGPLMAEFAKYRTRLRHL